MQTQAGGVALGVIKQVGIYLTLIYTHPAMYSGCRVKKVAAYQLSRYSYEYNSN